MQETVMPENSYSTTCHKMFYGMLKNENKNHMMNNYIYNMEDNYFKKQKEKKHKQQYYFFFQNKN